MKVLYFAWLKQKTGVGETDVTPPNDVKDVAGLIDWLKSRDDKHAAAFQDLSLVRCAVNQEYVGLDHPVKDGDEVAFFPPVTGG